MNLKKNAGSFSFVIYSLLALSLLFLYHGFSSLYGNALADFVLEVKQDVLYFPISYGRAATFLLLGSLLFFGTRAVDSKLETQGIIDTDSWTRVWILGIIVLISGLLISIDLFSLIAGVMEGKIGTDKLLITGITLALLSGTVSFCLSEFRRKQALELFTARSSAFLVFCMVSFGLAFFIAPPWHAKYAREDEKQMQRINQLEYALFRMHQKEGAIPASLNKVDDPQITMAEDLQDVLTGKPFTYTKLSDTSYEICAHFHTDYQLYKRYRLSQIEVQKEKEHEKGRSCYTIDVTKDHGEKVAPSKPQTQPDV